MIWDNWRLANLAVASVALLLHLWVFYRYRLWEEFDEVYFMGYLTIVAWCTGLTLATIVALTVSSGPLAGPWTAIMSVPAGWSLATAVLLWRRCRA